MSLFSRAALLLLVLSTVALAAPQEGLDGLTPPDALDRSAGVARIRQALAANDLALARKETEELAAREPRNFEAPFWAGYLAFRQGQFYDAIRDLRRAETLDPNPFVLKLLAVSYYAAHQQRLFLIKIHAAQKKQPEDFAPYYYLGRYYDSELTDFSRAAGFFEEALARRPDHFRSHYYLGHCYEAEQKVEQARAEYRRALELAGANDAGLPYQGLARLELSANRTAEALGFAKRAVELGPRDAAGHKLLARAYLDIGRDAEAAAEWKIAAELDPTDASALYRLYRGYLSLGEAEKADQALVRYKHIAELYGTN